MAGDKGKRILIHLSSSSSSDDDDGDKDGGCSDSASFASISADESIDDEDEIYEVDESEEEDDEEDDDDDSSDKERQGVEDDEDSLSNRVIQFLQENRDLQELSLKACKAYLRRHGLRVSGSKDECAQRIKEHWRIKDGKAEVLYPRSSFVINCTGDVCMGDIVLFTQKVYGSFQKMTRSGKLLGKRTVAGRVVKESYGAAKQQHTFTVEVLWSKGMKKLPPLSPLLVKGRNLYRLKTYRQPWKHEADRREVLAEKHKRGTVARLKRSKRKNAWPSDKGAKSQEISRSTRPSQLSYSERGKCVDRDQRASSSKHSTTSYYQRPCLRNQNLMIPERVFPLRPYYDAPREYPNPLLGSHHRRMPFSSTSLEFQREIPYRGPTMMPAAQYNGFDYRPFVNNSYGIQSPWMNHAESWKFFPSRTLPVQRQSGVFSCSTAWIDLVYDINLYKDN